MNVYNIDQIHYRQKYEYTINQITVLTIAYGLVKHLSV